MARKTKKWQRWEEFSCRSFSVTGNTVNHCKKGNAESPLKYIIHHHQVKSSWNQAWDRDLLSSLGTQIPWVAPARKGWVPADGIVLLSQELWSQLSPDQAGFTSQKSGSGCWGGREWARRLYPFTSSGQNEIAVLGSLHCSSKIYSCWGPKRLFVNI